MEDLISRQAAIAAIKNLYPGMPRVNFCYSQYKWREKNKEYIECEEIINKLPSAQPRPRGRWVAVDSYSAFGGDMATWGAHGNPTAFWYCSFCREQNYVGEDGEPLLTDFCPHCGAEMEAVDA